MFSEVNFRWEQGLLPSLPPSHKEYARIQGIALEIQTSTQCWQLVQSNLSDHSDRYSVSSWHLPPETQEWEGKGIKSFKVA